MIKKALLLALAFVVAAYADSQQVLFYTGSTLVYICESINQTTSTTTTYSRADSTITSIVILSNVATFTIPAHNLYPGARVTVSGSASGVIDGTFTISDFPSANTFTAPITAANATHTTSTLVVTTTAPLLNANQWSIQHFIAVGGLNISNPVFGSPQKNLKCSDRLLY